ncbi:MAG: FtsW/RodA/SpoVE family cell cycle protein [bacterium]|nr:FtsW/RodA/SpoVE family cell cycle protein [bacterium]
MNKIFKKIDFGIFLSSFLLVLIGLVSIYSSSITHGDFSNFYKQIFFFFVGFSVLIFLSLIDWNFLKSDSKIVSIIYFIFLVLLMGLFFFAPLTRGIKGWYKIGEFSFSPIEFVKILVIILLAKYFSSRHRTIYRTKDILKSFIYIVFPSAIVFFQPDLGSVLVLISIWAAMILISGIKIKHFAILVFCGLILFSFAWAFLLKDYQKERLVSFTHPQIDPKGISWNLIQSKIAIGNGGFLGQGFGKGSQTQYGFLPERQTDFIYSSVAEEFGLVGVSIILACYAFLIWRIIKISVSIKNETNNFIRLYSFGLITLFFSQALINIGMSLGLLPIIGLPLPFVSYSGSCLISCYIGLGILMSMKS